MRRPWTRADLATLRRMRCVELASHETIAAALGRSPAAVKGKLAVCRWGLPVAAWLAARRGGNGRSDALREGMA